MIVARKGKTVDYVLQSDRAKPEEDQTIFELDAGLSRGATAVINDSLIGYSLEGEVMTSRPGTGALTACKLGIAGIRNLLDEDRNAIRPKFRTQRVGGKRGKGGGGTFRMLASETLDLIPQWAINELGGEIMELNRLDEGTTDEEEPDGPLADRSTTSSSSSSSPPVSPAT